MAFHDASPNTTSGLKDLWGSLIKAVARGNPFHCLQHDGPNCNARRQLISRLQSMLRTDTCRRFAHCIPDTLGINGSTVQCKRAVGVQQLHGDLVSLRTVISGRRYLARLKHAQQRDCPLPPASDDGLLEQRPGPRVFAPAAAAADDERCG